MRQDPPHAPSESTNDAGPSLRPRIRHGSVPSGHLPSLDRFNAEWDYFMGLDTSELVAPSGPQTCGPHSLPRPIGAAPAARPDARLGIPGGDTRLLGPVVRDEIQQAVRVHVFVVSKIHVRRCSSVGAKCHIHREGLEAREREPRNLQTMSDVVVNLRCGTGTRLEFWNACEIFDDGRNFLGKVEPTLSLSVPSS